MKFIWRLLLNSQAKGASGKNEQSTQTLWRAAPEARGPMQLHRLHRLKAGPENRYTACLTSTEPSPECFQEDGFTFVQGSFTF